MTFPFIWVYVFTKWISCRSSLTYVALPLHGLPWRTGVAVSTADLRFRSVSPACHSAPAVTVFGLASNVLYPTPPVSKNHLAQEPTPGSAVKFSHHFFNQGSGFFMFLVDVGQLFRCAGHHFMCVTTGPPIRGDPISHSQAHIPLKPLRPALDPFPEATSP